MNYRHAYHAGNFADVFKHAVLIELLESFKSKPTAFCFLDTHAGRGIYDLAGNEARKTGEAADGVLRLLALEDPPACLRAYIELFRSINGQAGTHGVRRYPGSPLLADHLLREHDRAILCEWQADEANALRALLRDHRSIQIHQRDGYEALTALLPPQEKRGLVLIDPPFEARAQEFRLIERALEGAISRWPTGRYVVWYPIKLRPDIRPFHRWLKQHYAGRSLIAEFLVHPADSDLRLNGCGLALINPPWQFENVLDSILAALCAHLAQDDPAEMHIDQP